MFYQIVPSVKRVFFPPDAASITVAWMTSSSSCFCRPAKAISGWWEMCHQLIWNMSLVDRELYESHLKFSVVRKDKTTLTSGVLKVLRAAWHFDCFLRQICMCDCLGEKIYTQQNLMQITLGDRLPLAISHIICSVNRVKQFATFPGSIMYMCLFNQN